MTASEIFGHVQACPKRQASSDSCFPYGHCPRVGQSAEPGTATDQQRRLQSAPDASLRQRPLLADTVEKVSSGRRMEFFRTAGASHERRCEGPRRFTQKRSSTFVTVLQRLSAAETAKDRPSRDFRSLSNFDFFNSIGAKRTFVERSTSEKWHKQTQTAAINSFTYRQRVRCVWPIAFDRV
jgi:hypothetical protein